MNTNNKDKRLLVICDLSRITWCVGEFLRFQMETLIKRAKYGVDKIDIIWVYNPANPAIPKAMRIGRVTKKNSGRYLRELLPLGRVNQHLGTFTLMDIKGLEEFVKDNSDRYIIDPSMEEIRRGDSFHPYVFNKLLVFYEEKGFLPLLSCSSDTLSWAYHFLGKVGGYRGYPVVMQLRSSRFGRKKINSPLNEWLEFFTECRKKFKEVKFIIISRRKEIKSRFEEPVRALGNVIFSKKHGVLGEHATTVEQDCALVQASKICMGSSGTTGMAMFSGTPCLAFNPNRASWKGGLSSSQQVFFATPLQKLIWKDTTKKVIMEEFEKLYRQVVERDEKILQDKGR